MKQRLSLKTFFTLFAVVAIALFATLGCEPDGETGDFSQCTYTSGLYDTGYSSAIVYYPCETDAGPFAATTLTGGYTNTKEDMEWISEGLVTHGYIIFAMTPNNILGTNSSWTRAHNAGIEKLRTENNRSSSPIHGLVKTDALQIMGFSKGGGGALLAAADQGDAVRATQALAPYMDFSYDLSDIQSQTIVHAGSSDLIASARNAESMFEDIPNTVDRTFANFRGLSHGDWYGRSGSDRDRLMTYMIGWMKVYLDGDMSYQNVIDGHQSWFSDFIHLPAGTGGGCD